MIVDYFILKRHRKILDETREKGLLPETAENLNPITIFAWILGSASGYLIAAGIPSLNSLVIAGLAYYIGMKLFASNKGQQSAEVKQAV
jgi:cytosine permease